MRMPIKDLFSNPEQMKVIKVKEFYILMALLLTRK